MTIKSQKKLAAFGDMGSGKDFTADYIVELYGYTRYAFADEVRDVAKEYFPELYGTDDKKNRWLLREVATLFRSINKDVWVNKLFDNINKQQEWLNKHGYQEEYIIITDCRFPNEYKRLKEEGYIFIKIESDDAIRNKRMIDRGDILDNKNVSHESESFYNSFEADYTIYNNTSPRALYQQIDGVLQEILEVY